MVINHSLLPTRAKQNEDEAIARGSPTGRKSFLSLDVEYSNVMLRSALTL